MTWHLAKETMTAPEEINWRRFWKMITNDTLFDFSSKQGFEEQW